MRLALSNPQPALLRATAWALIGAIYAPLFLTLDALLSQPLGEHSVAAAAMVAGAVGAAFYGARHAALAASVVGVVAASFVLLALDGDRAFWIAALLAAGLGVLTGLAVDFPSRCTDNVLAKVSTGAVTGALCGGLLGLIAEGFQVALTVPMVVAFLVSVNGILYISGVRPMARLTRQIPARFCAITEGVMIAVIGVVVAGNVWIFAGILMGDGQSDRLVAAVADSADLMPIAVAAGVLAGGVTGALLELFEFPWIDDL